MDTYFDYQYSKYRNYTNETVVIEGKTSLHTLNDFLVNSTTHHYPYKKIINNTAIKQLTNGKQVIQVYADIVGTTSGFQQYLVPNFTDDHAMTFYQLASGRSIAREDFRSGAPVGVIDQFTAELLFRGENPIGQTVKVPIMEEKLVNGAIEHTVAHHQDIEIIGVIANRELLLQQQLSFRQKLNNHPIKLNSKIFVPYTLAAKLGKNLEDFDQVVIHLSDYDKKSVNDIQQIINWNDSLIQSQVVTKQLLYNDIENKSKNTKKSLQIFMVVIILVIGLIIMNTMFFSVKERISEIGIKKALGATDEDIIVHFIIEGLLIGLIGSLVGTIVGVVGSTAVIAYLKETSMPLLSISLDSIGLLLIIIICTFQSVIFTVIPSIYGARIKVVDAIRFE